MKYNLKTIGGFISVENRSTGNVYKVDPDSLGFFKIQLQQGINVMHFVIRPDRYEETSLKLYIEEGQDTTLKRKVLLKKKKTKDCDWARIDDDMSSLLNSEKKISPDLEFYRIYGWEDRMPGSESCPSVIIEIMGDITQEYVVNSIYAKCDSSIVKLGYLNLTPSNTNTLRKQETSK